MVRPPIFSLTNYRLIQPWSTNGLETCMDPACPGWDNPGNAGDMVQDYSCNQFSPVVIC